MKLTKLVQESVPKKSKRLRVMISESHLKFLIDKALDNPNSKQIINNEKK